ncbi:hypothetical protein FRC11_005150 [Ceratobasidium sp. 423]|nr:hypothetical protein FRC11_005150 [Ceratobasidium sp. 423]
MVYSFKCKHDPDHCQVRRKQKNTSRDGTQNLRKAIQRCDLRHNLPDSRFDDHTARFGPAPSPESGHPLANPTQLSAQPHPLWMQVPASTHHNSTTPNSAEINKVDGLLQFWENEAKAGSVLGRMALDILTAPFIFR